MTVPVEAPACLIPTSAAEERRFERQVKSGKMVSPIPGLFADAAYWGELDSMERARSVIEGLSRKHEDWVFCLFSAALMYGLEVGRDQTDLIHLSKQGRVRQGRDPRFVRHRRKGSGFVQIGGTKVTPRAETVVDCLLELPFARGLAIADSAMRVLGLTRDELYAELGSREVGTGWRIARDAILYADPRSANGGESVARAVMIEQGFAIPELQVKTSDPMSPGHRYFVDYLWRLPSGDVIGELDGKDKYVLPEMTEGRDAVEVMIDERHRESRLTVAGAKVMRFSFRDVMKTESFVSLLELYGIPRGAARVIGA